MDDLCFTQFLKLVQDVDWLNGTPVSFPKSASWKDPQVLLADSTEKRFAALVQVLHRRNGYWSITNLRDNVPVSHVDQMRSVSIPAKLTKRARWLFSQMHLRCLSTQFLCLSHCPFGPITAWVTTEWLSFSNGEKLFKKGRFGNALVRRSLGRASPVVTRSLRRSSTKERAMPASGDCGIRTWQLYETFLFCSWERVWERSLIGFTTQNKWSTTLAQVAWKIFVRKM